MTKLVIASREIDFGSSLLPFSVYYEICRKCVSNCWQRVKPGHEMANARKEKRLGEDLDFLQLRNRLCVRIFHVRSTVCL